MTTCPTCGAPADEQELWCKLAFEQMLVWDFTDPHAGAVHHLTVLCYHLQHPHLYSQAGLDHAKHLLYQFLIIGKSPQALRHEMSESVQSDTRTFSISAKGDDKGAYQRPITWSYTAYDVLGNDITGYPDRVRHWAKSIYEALVTHQEIILD